MSLLHRPYCADCYWQLPQHTVHTLRERCPAGMMFSECHFFTYMAVSKKLIHLWWLSVCWDDEQFVCFLGVWPGCWWAGYESCGNHVTELHCCGCWKHSQVCPDLLHLKRVSFTSVINSLRGGSKNVFSTSLKVSFLCRTIDRSVFKPIVQISVIDRSESSDCHLLAVTHAGKHYRTVVKMNKNCRICVGWSEMCILNVIFCFCRCATLLQHHTFCPSTPEACGSSA